MRNFGQSAASKVMHIHEKNKVQNKNLHNYSHPLYQTDVGVEGITYTVLLQNAKMASWQQLFWLIDLSMDIYMLPTLWWQYCTKQSTSYNLSRIEFYVMHCSQMFCDEEEDTVKNNLEWKHYILSVISRRTRVKRFCIGTQFTDGISVMIISNCKNKKYLSDYSEHKYCKMFTDGSTS